MLPELLLLRMHAMIGCFSYNIGLPYIFVDYIFWLGDIGRSFSGGWR